MIFSKQSESRLIRVAIVTLAGAFCFALLDVETDLPGAPATPSEQGPIPIDEIESRGVLGRLGHPLGTVLTVDGVVIDGNTTFNKNYTGRLWLDVQTVDEESLEEIERFEFDLEEFYPHGVNIDDDDLPPIMTESHGEGFRYQVYETGGYTGGPPEWPLEIPIVAGRFWRFETHLVVIRDLAPTDD